MQFVRLKLFLQKYVKQGTLLWKVLQTLYGWWNGLWRLKGPLGVLPDFLIIGVQKGGTTSLYHYLIQHPDVFSATTKEIEYFSKYSYRGLWWYRSFFPSCLAKWFRKMRGRKFITGEASTSYSFFPGVAERVKKALPNVKVIVLLRDPVDRAYSQYNHQKRKGRETLSFEEALEKERERLKGEREKLLKDPQYQSFNYDHFSYTSRGKYDEVLKPWLERFEDNMLVLCSEDLNNSPGKVTNKVFDFLGLKPHSLSEYHKMDKVGYKKMKASTRKKLERLFAPHNERLKKRLGAVCGWLKT